MDIAFDHVSLSPLHPAPAHSTPRFAVRIQEQDEQDMKPIFTEAGVTYVYIKYNNLYLLALTKKNANVAVILLYLYRICNVRERRPSMMPLPMMPLHNKL